MKTKNHHNCWIRNGSLNITKRLWWVFNETRDYTHYDFLPIGQKIHIHAYAAQLETLYLKLRYHSNWWSKTGIPFVIIRCISCQGLVISKREALWDLYAFKITSKNERCLSNLETSAVSSYIIGIYRFSAKICTETRYLHQSLLFLLRSAFSRLFWTSEYLRNMQFPRIWKRGSILSWQMYHPIIFYIRQRVGPRILLIRWFM